MPEVKMSDVFGAGVTYDKFNDWLISDEGESFAYFVSGYKDKCSYTAIAINSHDVNQSLITKQSEQIKVLREALTDLGKAMFINNEEALKQSIINANKALEATKD